MKKSFAPVSRFDQILADLRERVGRREFEALPTERSLAEHYECSQATMNKVVATLVIEGLVSREGRRCTLRPVRFMSWLASEKLGAPVSKAIKASFRRLDLETVPFSQFQTELTESIGAGNAPDVAQITNNWTSRFAHLGALRSLEGKLSPKILSDHITWMKQPNKYEGVTYSIDWGLSPLLLFCNRVEHAPQSLDELLALSRKVGFAAPTAEDEITAVFFLPFLFAHGASFNEDSLTRPEAVAALAYYRELVTGPIGVSIWDWRKRFAKHDVGLLCDGSMGRGFFRTESGLGEAFDAHMIAAPVPGATITVNHSLALLRQSTCESEAVAFIEHLLSDRELARLYYEHEGLLPARRSLLSLPEYQEPYARLVLEQSLAARSLPTHQPTLQMALAFLGSAIHRTLKKEIEPAAALADAARNIRLLFTAGGHL